MNNFVTGKRAPILSVALPVFNAGRYLRPAVLSIIQQSFTDWELLLIDDGSSDGAVAALELDDDRIRIISDGKNRGLAARLNEAIDLACGELFARMDQDDISHPERFARQIEALNDDPFLDLVGSQCLRISEEGEILGTLPKAEKHEEICACPWLGFYLPHPTWMGRLTWFKRHRYASPGPYCCEDQELLLRTYMESRFQSLPQFLLAYRVRDHIAFMKSWRTRVTVFKVQIHHFVNFSQWFFLLLAAFGFCFRLINDLFSLNMKYALLRIFNKNNIFSVRNNIRSEWILLIEKFSEDSIK